MRIIPLFALAGSVRHSFAAAVILNVRNAVEEPLIETLGYVGTSGNLDYGVGRTLMKFPGLMSNEIFLSLADSEISNVSLVLAEVSGKSGAATIRAHYYTGPAWTENGVTYNNCSWNGLGSAISMRL